LGTLADRLADRPLMLLLMFRPTLEPGALGVRQIPHTVIEITPLSGADSDALLDAWFRHSACQFPERLRAMILGRAGGNPLYLEEVVRSLIADGVLVRELDAQSAWFLAPWMLVRADRFEEAAPVVDRALEHSRATGSQLGYARSSWLRAELDYAAGDLLGAEAHARSAHAIASEGGSHWVRLMAGALLAQILADRGEPDEAGEILDSLELSMIAPGERLSRAVHYARGYVALLAGRPDDAVSELAHLRETVRIAPAGRSRFATGMAVHAIALSRVGRSEEARALADEELRWAERWGSPRFIGMALRARSHTVADAERIDELQAAVAALERAPARLELARALGDLGSALRRLNQRSASREPLRRALDLARRCRADAFAEHLRGELRAAGARPRRELLTGRDSLTASEARIAEMAATGMTNAQIAQAIFVTPATVEKHLTSVYSKLGVPSRRGLAAALHADSTGTG
jgi:ATP/maltotriose-dependent transcriptional regulator MalT